MNVSERLNAVAQRLDELADEGPSELTTIAEELGRIADEVPTYVLGVDPARGKEAPEWMERIQHEIEHAAMEIVGSRYGRTNPAHQYHTINLPNPAYYRAAMMTPTPDLSKIVLSGVFNG